LSKGGKCPPLPPLTGSSSQHNHLDRAFSHIFLYSSH